jgi:hypothetical protein
MSIIARSRYHAPTVRLRHTHHRDIINSTTCSACEHPLGQPCMLNDVERLSTDTIHTCLLSDDTWLEPMPITTSDTSPVAAEGEAPSASRSRSWKAGRPPLLPGVDCPAGWAREPMLAAASKLRCPYTRKEKKKAGTTD